MDRVEAVILRLALETEFALYEVLWELRGHYPTLPDDALLELARRAAIRLANRGFIEFLYRDANSNELASVPVDQGLALLALDGSWAPPLKGSAEVFIIITSDGELARSEVADVRLNWSHRPASIEE